MGMQALLLPSLGRSPQLSWVEASSELRRVENVYYPPALLESAPASSEADTAPEVAEAGQDSATNAPTPLDKPAEETEHLGVSEKEKIIS